MTEQIAFISPAGTPRRATAHLADRVADLSSTKLVLFDNGQIEPELVRFGPLLDQLAEDLPRAIDGLEIVRISADLVTRPVAALAQLKDEIVAMAPAGVVIAICHGGVTAPSAILAAKLERAGCPCLLICTPLGEPLVDVMSSYDVPGMPTVRVLNIVGRTQQDLDAQRAEIVRSVLATLQGSAGDIERDVLKHRKGDPAAGLRELTIRREAPQPERDRADRYAEDVYLELARVQMGDGLPVCVPTEQRVRDMMAAVDRAPDDVVLDVPVPNAAPITIRGLAANAVLAGCRPDYFPVVVTAFEAMADPEYRFFQTAITTHPGGNAVVVSGPYAERVGIQSGPGCLGPGFRANATIGRAVNLSIMNLCRSIPGRSDLATMGSAARFTFCFAEIERDNPWMPLHEEYFDAATTSVTVMKVESPHNIISNTGPHPQDLLSCAADVAATLGANSLRWPSPHLVIINPSQARMMLHEGWTKDDVRHFLFDTARIRRDAYLSGRYAAARPRWTHFTDDVPVVREPRDFIVVVAGGIANQMMIAPPWGLCQAVTRPLRM